MAYEIPSSLPPIECLTAALVAARTGSFSQTALELGVSHAAISRRVSAAEAWAGTKLFTRHGRGVRPTDDGQRLLGRVAHAFDLIDQTANIWRKRQRARLVRISTTHSLANLWLYPRIGEIEAAFPDVRIEVSVSYQNVNLDNGDADIAIRCGKGGWKIGTETRLFGEETLRPVVSKQFYEAHHRVLSGDGIMTLPLIHNSDSSGWQAWAHARDLIFRGKLSDRVCSDYQLTLSAAAAHLGVALVSNILLPEKKQEDCLVAVDAPLAINPLSYFVIVSSRQASPVVDSCVAKLLELGIGKAT
jgi:LysR family transcriptional regulator, glycine cleavage system transcriptional activator